MLILRYINPHFVYIYHYSDYFIYLIKYTILNLKNLYWNQWRILFKNSVDFIGFKWWCFGSIIPKQQKRLLLTSGPYLSLSWFLSHYWSWTTSWNHASTQLQTFWLTPSVTYGLDGILLNSWNTLPYYHQSNHHGSWDNLIWC